MLCIIGPGPSRKISVEQRVIITVMTSGGRITWHTSYRARGMLYIITILSSILLLTFLLIPKHLRETLIISSISDGFLKKSKTTILQCPFLSPPPKKNSNWRQWQISHCNAKWLVEKEMDQRWLEKLLLVSDLRWKIAGGAVGLYHDYNNYQLAGN